MDKRQTPIQLILKIPKILFETVILDATRPVEMESSGKKDRWDNWDSWDKATETLFLAYRKHRKNPSDPLFMKL